MKHYKLLVVIFVLALFLPQAVMADGKNKPRKKAVVSKKAVRCDRLKGRAKQRCEAKRAAAIAAEARRRAEAARRAELAAQAQENRFRNVAKANIAKDDTAGEDLSVRQMAINALDGKAGTVVVMDPQTGKIYTIVNQEWGIRQAYKPCSTIKLVTGIAGLKNAVDDDESEDPKFGVDLDKAIAKSNNAYFDRLGARVGTEKFVSTAQTLGLGEKTGINAVGETAGRLPLVKKTGQTNLRYYSFGDGTEVTPLQLAVLAAGIVNGGHKVKPFIQKAGLITAPQLTTINVPQETLKELIPGMQGATEFGTARKSGGFLLGVAGKTGTCSDAISRIGLFTSVAPVDNPKYAVVVVIRGRKDQTSGPYAAKIAGKVYQALLKDDSSDQFESQLPSQSSRTQVLQY